MLFALLAYTVFFATFLYLVGFVADLPGLPHTVDHGPQADVGPAAIIDLGLIALFGIQHSVMARRGFKAACEKIVPPPIERSVYVLFASAALIILFLFWHPIAGAVWSAQSPAGMAILWGLFAAGWLIVLLSTFLLNHFELFGLAQVFRHWRGTKPADPMFRTPFFYRLVRHPLYSGFFLAFWATPEMTTGHLLLSVGMSIYMLIAIQYEERDLVHSFGAQYEEYRLRVGMLTPKVGRR
jgi:protein-S-isoprenylcysteine O-methyltransferase Ste14